MNEEMLRIINSVEPSWSKDLIIRFLYVKLAPFFQRDLLFFCASFEEKYEQYKQGFINRFPYITCSTLADFYVNLFNEFGIEARKVVANSAKIPLFAILVRSDNCWYFLDPLNDLLNNQYGLQTQNFGIIPSYNTIRNNYPEISSLNPAYIFEMDKTLQLIPKSGYLDLFFESLSSQILNQNDASAFFHISKKEAKEIMQAKLSLMNSEFINLGHVNGPYERILLYFYLFKKSFNKTEDKYIKTYLGPNNDQEANVFIELKTQNNGSILYEERKENGIFRLNRIR